MFSGPEHRFLPLNLDWSPKSFSEGKTGILKAYLRENVNESSN